MYKPRRTTPSNDDKRFIQVNYGGWNKCIEGSPKLFTGSVLANCVGYVWGRALELLDLKGNYEKLKLPTTSAYTWYGNTSDGYERGQFPKLGAIACWGQSGGSGHLAIVEQILPNGDILCSNSVYGGTGLQIDNYPYFYMWTYKKSANYINGFSTGFYFQGFIYLPIKSQKGFPFVLYARKLRGE